MNPRRSPRLENPPTEGCGSTRACARACSPNKQCRKRDAALITHVPVTPAPPPGIHVWSCLERSDKVDGLAPNNSCNNDHIHTHTPGPETGEEESQVRYCVAGHRTEEDATTAPHLAGPGVGGRRSTCASQAQRGRQQAYGKSFSAIACHLPLPSSRAPTAARRPVASRAHVRALTLRRWADRQSCAARSVTSTCLVSLQTTSLVRTARARHDRAGQREARRTCRAGTAYRQQRLQASSPSLCPTLP